jgi:hypothetical protein
VTSQLPGGKEKDHGEVDRLVLKYLPSWYTSDLIRWGTFISGSNQHHWIIPTSSIVKLFQLNNLLHVVTNPCIRNWGLAAESVITTSHRFSVLYWKVEAVLHTFSRKIHLLSHREQGSKNLYKLKIVR